MKSVLFLFALFGFSLGYSAQAAELRRYRWHPKTWKPLPHLFTATLDKVLRRQPSAPVVVALGPLARHQQVLRAKGELVEKGTQALGPAFVDGTWLQTIMQPSGRVSYAAGAVFDDLPEDTWLKRVKDMKAREGLAIARATELVEEYRVSPKRSAPELRLRRQSYGNFEAYWRLEYLNRNQDAVNFLELGEDGSLLAEGLVDTAHADGRGWAYPRGPKWSPLTEVPLHQLNGDGTLTSRFFRITSALSLNPVSPDLLFFFPAADRRFDLSQVYFTIERSLDWMKKFLGAEISKPLEVKLHVGNGGVSNAAFYHDSVIYLGTGDGTTYQELARDPSVVTHESVHALVDTYAGLPAEGEGGALNEGFADFFTALILNNPHMGDNSYLLAPYRRSVENDWKAYRDFDGIYRNGSIVAGTLWDLRPLLGDEKLGQLAFRTLNRLGAGGTLADFAPALLHAAGELLSANELTETAKILQVRGWSVSVDSLR